VATQERPDFERFRVQKLCQDFHVVTLPGQPWFQPVNLLGKLEGRLVSLDALQPTPTKARVQQINKKREESRSIVTAPVSAQAVCFPLAEQAALLLRQTEGREDELVALITSVEPSRLDAQNWLRLNPDAWGH
jgi:hypothetical protein